MELLMVVSLTPDIFQDDTGHSDTPQGIGHIDSGVWEMTGLIHD